MNNLKEVDRFSVNTRKSQCFLHLIFLLMAGLGVGVICLTKLYKYNNIPIWIIIFSVILFIIAHELIHIFFMLVFAKGKINISFKIPTIAVGSNAYFSKLQYCIIALAPVAILGIITLICLIVFSYKFLFAILLVLNFASASGDYILTIYAIKQNRGVYFVDDSKFTVVYKEKD